MDNKFTVITAPQPKSFAFRALKVCLIIFQVLCFIWSMVLLLLAAIAFAVAKDQKYPEKTRSGAIVVEIAGCVTLIVSLIGLVGSIKEKCGLTIIFGIILILDAIIAFVMLNLVYGLIEIIVAIIAFNFAYHINKDAA